MIEMGEREDEKIHAKIRKENSVEVKCLVLEGDYECFGFNCLEKLVNSNISGTAILEIDFGTSRFRVYDKK